MAKKPTPRPLWSYGLAELARTAECEAELSDLCSAVLRIGWDRDVADVKRQAEDIIARLNIKDDAPLAAHAIET